MTTINGLDWMNGLIAAPSAEAEPSLAPGKEEAKTALFAQALFASFGEDERPPAEGVGEMSGLGHAAEGETAVMVLIAPRVCREEVEGETQGVVSNLSGKGRRQGDGEVENETLPDRAEAPSALGRETHKRSDEHPDRKEDFPLTEVQASSFPVAEGLSVKTPVSHPVQVEDPAFIEGAKGEGISFQEPLFKPTRRFPDMGPVPLTEEKEADPSPPSPQTTTIPATGESPRKEGPPVPIEKSSRPEGATLGDEPRVPTPNRGLAWGESVPPSSMALRRIGEEEHGASPVAQTHREGDDREVLSPGDLGAVSKKASRETAEGETTPDEAIHQYIPLKGNAVSAVSPRSDRERVSPLLQAVPEGHGGESPLRREGPEGPFQNLGERGEIRSVSQEGDGGQLLMKDLKGSSPALQETAADAPESASIPSLSLKSISQPARTEQEETPPPLTGAREKARTQTYAVRAEEGKTSSGPEGAEPLKSDDVSGRVRPDNNAERKAGAETTASPFGPTPLSEGGDKAKGIRAFSVPFERRGEGRPEKEPGISLAADGRQGIPREDGTTIREGSMTSSPSGGRSDEGVGKPVPHDGASAPMAALRGPVEKEGPILSTEVAAPGEKRTDGPFEQLTGTVSKSPLQGKGVETLFPESASLEKQGEPDSRTQSRPPKAEASWPQSPETPPLSPEVRGPIKTPDAGFPHLLSLQRSLEKIIKQDHPWTIRQTDRNSWEIVLEPEGLGKVDVELNWIQDRLQGQILVQDAAGKEMIERNLPLLLQDLSREGVQIGGFSVSLKNKGQDVFPREGPPLEREPDRPVVAAVLPRRSSDHRVDIVI